MDVHYLINSYLVPIFCRKHVKVLKITTKPIMMYVYNKVF